MSKKSKILIFISGRAFKVLLFLMILLAIGIGWYTDIIAPRRNY